MINAVVSQAVSCFLDNEARMLQGLQEEPLMSMIPARESMERLVEVASRHIYCAPEVVEIQAAGFQVIGDLLERFIEALDDLAEHGDGATPRSKMLSHLVPQQFKGGRAGIVEGLYPRLLSLTDFVAGMTDSYAVSLYKR